MPLRVITLLGNFYKMNKSGLLVGLVVFCVIGVVLGGLFTYFFVSEQYDYDVGKEHCNHSLFSI